MFSIKDWLRVEPKEIVRKIIDKGYRVELYISAFRECIEHLNEDLGKIVAILEREEVL